MITIQATHDELGDINVEITDVSVSVSGDVPADIQQDLATIEEYESVRGETDELDGVEGKVDFDVYEPASIDEKRERVIEFLDVFDFEVTEGRRASKAHKCLSGITDETVQNAPEWDQPLLEMHQQVWDADPERELTGLAESATPEFVKERIRNAIMGGAIFSDFETVPSGELMQLREYMTETLESDGWTIDGLTDQLQQLPGLEDRDRAETIARTETASVLNSAREDGYEERGQGDERFYWSGNLDGRQTKACEWLIKKTNPFEGGTPVQLDELKELIEEAPTHDPEMQDDLARPDDFCVHPNERKTFIRHVG